MIPPVCIVVLRRAHWPPDRILLRRPLSCGAVTAWLADSDGCGRGARRPRAGETVSGDVRRHRRASGAFTPPIPIREQ